MSRRKIGGASAPKKKAASGSTVSPAQATAIIGSAKENVQLSEAVKLYEARQYKKSVKILDAILKKNSSHFDSLSVKALNLFFMNDKDQAESYAKKAVSKTNGTKSLCTHTGSFVLGLYYKHLKNYEESAKWYQTSLDNGSPNQHTRRELSVLCMQLREFDRAVTERTTYLQSMMGYRANWTALALSLDLAGKPAQAAKYLANFEDLAKGKLGPDEMYENSECIMYKNDLYYKAAGNDSEKLKTVLEDLDVIEESVYDKYALLERRASIYMKLGDLNNASKVYRKLIKRNPDDFKYYRLLEVSLGISDSESLKLALYEKLNEFYPRSEPAKYLPLTFLTDETKLKRKLNEYLLPQLERGVLAVFSSIKPLYKKRPGVIPSLVESIVEEFLANKVDPVENANSYIWTLYFLAQHHLLQKNFIKAQECIDKALKHTPTAIELYIVKARILKHLGLLEEAAKVVEEARQLDLQDRYINNKSVKYHLRCNNVDKAVDLISLFTKNDEKDVNGVKDLHTLEAGWFLVEQAESYSRLYLSRKRQILDKLNNSSDEQDARDEQFDELKYEMDVFKGLAMKRFASISNIYNNFNDDQYDFHSYCTRKGTCRAYLDLFSWEDQLYTLPIYVRAMEGYSKILFNDNVQENNIISPANEDGVNNKKKNKKSFKQKQNDDTVKYASELNDKDPLGASFLQKTKESPTNIFCKIFYNNYNKQVLMENKDNILEYLVNLKEEKLPVCISAMNKLLVKGDTRVEKKNYRAIVGAMCLILTTLLEEHGDSLDAISKTVVSRSLTEQFKFSKESCDANAAGNWFEYLKAEYGVSVYSVLILYHYYYSQEESHETEGECSIKNYISPDDLKTQLLSLIENYDPVDQFSILNYEL